MDPVRSTSRRSNILHSRQSVILLFIVCLSIGSIFISNSLVSDFKDVFQSTGMNPFGSVSSAADYGLGSTASHSPDIQMDMSREEEVVEEEFEHESENENDKEKESEPSTTTANEQDQESSVQTNTSTEESSEKAKEDNDNEQEGSTTSTTPAATQDGDGDGDANEETTSSKEANNDKDNDQDKDTETETDTNPDQDPDPKQRMNVLILFPDDWRYNSIGKENTIVQTPFLDSLADDGIHFPQNAVTTSICWQSRATLFSGQWASRHQSYKLRCPHFSKGRLWNQTWPVLLQKNGYYVGHVGKWQYHSDNRDRFDWSSYHEGKHWYTKKKKLIAAEDLAKDDAIRFLNERPKDKPFAMTVAFYPPKPVSGSTVPGGQWTPKQETRAIYENMTIPEPYNMTHAFNLLPLFLQRDRSAAVDRWRRRYSTPLHYQEAMKNIYALITQVDDASRQIVDEIKRQGLYNNTMIIFTTDNGMFHGSHGLAGKWYPYQESIRVPLIVHDPRMPKDKVGTVDEHFTLNVDLAETILGAAGVKPHERMQGRDISDLYLEKSKKTLEQHPWRKDFFYEFTFFDENFIPSSNALVSKKWKYIHWYGKDFEQLFDMEVDPMEFTDVKDDPANAEILKEMRAKMLEYKSQLEEPEGDRLPCSGGNWSVNPPDEQ